MAGEGRKSIPALPCWRGEAEHPGPTTGVTVVFSALPGQGEQLIRLAQTLRAMPKVARLSVEVIQTEPFLPLEFSPCSAAAKQNFLE